MITYCFLDVEVDGPTPGANSMLGLGFAAFDEDGHELDVFEVHLETLEGSSGAKEAMRWWRAHPEAWNHVRRDPVLPAEGMARCLAWLEGLGTDLVLAAHPLLFDGIWLDWYFREILRCRRVPGALPHPLSLCRRRHRCAVLCSGCPEHGLLQNPPGLSTGPPRQCAAYSQADRRRPRTRRALLQRPSPHPLAAGLAPCLTAARPGPPVGPHPEPPGIRLTLRRAATLKAFLPQGAAARKRHRTVSRAVA